MNSGKCRQIAEIWGKSKSGTVNKLGEKVYEDVELKKLFVEFQNKTGSMLYGRAADTKLAKTTHKISFRYLNYPDLGYENYFKINNQRYNIEYIDNFDNKNEVLEVFLSRQ